MYLEIDNPEGLEIKEFASWMIEQIKEFVKLKSAREPSLESLWDNYLTTNDLGWVRDEFDEPICPSVDFIINSFFNNLIIKDQGQNKIITIDPAVKVRGTNLTIEMLASLINYGTLLVPPYPYFDSVFQVFADDLQYYYEEWAEGTGEELLNYEESEEEV